jgi:hypothetical protein
MLEGTTICKACGYNFSDRLRARPRAWSVAIVIGAAVVLLVGLALVLAAELRHRPKSPKSSTVLAGARGKDSARLAAPGKGGEQESLAAASREASKPAPGQALVKQYQSKIDGVQQEVTRIRKRLNDSKRMTQKSQDILNKIESDLNGLKGTVSALATTPTRESQAALEAVIDSRLVATRKQFAEIQP